MQNTRRTGCKPEHFSAASDYAKQLTKALILVGDAIHLVRMIAEALCEAGAAAVPCRPKQPAT